MKSYCKTNNRGNSGKLLNEDLSLLDISIDGVSTIAGQLKGQLFIPLVGRLRTLFSTGKKRGKLYWYIGRHRLLPELYPQVAAQGARYSKSSQDLALFNVAGSIFPEK